jgi:intracellular septation protein A
MQSSMVLLGIIPLLVFVIVDSFSSMKAALISAIVFAILEAIFTYFYFGELDSVTIASLLLVILMACAAIKSNSDTLFLLQPVILSAGIGIYLIVSYYMGHPLFLEMSLKYKEFFPEQIRLMVNQPHYQILMRKVSLTSGFGMLAHGAVTAYAAFRMGKWWWIVVRGVGLYLFIFLSYIAALFI